jgi:sugar lactone lactonase YvrE
MRSLLLLLAAPAALLPARVGAAQPAFRWVYATAYAIPKETTNQGSGYFSIVTGKNGRLYIGTAKYGVGSYLVEFDLKTTKMRVVVDTHQAIGTKAKGFAAQSKIHTRNNVGSSGKIYFGTKQGYPAKGEKRTDYPGGYPMVYDPKTGKTRVYPIPVPHQGIISITPDESRGIAYISTCADTRPDSTHFMILNLKTGKYRDLMDCRHMFAFIVVDHLGRAYHSILGGDIARYDPRTGRLERLKQTIDGKPPTAASLLALPETHPINWDISPDGKTLYALPMSGNQLYRYDLTAQGDTLPGKSLGPLLKDTKTTDCRAMCVGPTGEVWAAVTGSYPNYPNLLHLVRYRPGDKAPRDLGAVGLRNPDFTPFTDPSGKPLPNHHGFQKMPDGTTTTKYVILGVSQAQDGTVYVLALSPYTLLQIKPGDLAGRWPRAGSLTLVRDGKPQASIVVAKAALTAKPDPDPARLHEAPATPSKIAAAARDLQHYVAKITGAKLPIVSDEKDPGGAAILVGKSALTAKWDGQIPAGLTPAREEEGFVLLCWGNRLLLAGNDAGPYHGTEYAVAELLHRQGIRWFMPGDYGEVVPRRATLEVSEGEVRQKPDFKMRNWWGAQTPANQLLDYRWKIRNKMNPVLHFITIPGDSSARGLIPPELVKTQPELFALTADGKRDTALPNLSNPKAAAVAAQTIMERFRKDPALTSAGFAPDDGLPRDYNPETLRLNLGFPDLVGRAGVPAELSMSEEWFTFVNRVARAVRQKYPHHVLTTNGYANRNTPPLGLRLEPNVWVMFAAIWSDTLHAYDDPHSWQTYRQGQMIRRWAKMCRNVYLYDYTYIMLASAGTPVPLARKHRRDMPLLKKWGVIGFSDEGRRVLAEAGVYPPYLRARMMWDAGLDANALLDDFFTKWYGTAAKPARVFWDALEEAIEKTPMLGHEDRILPYVYTPELLAALARHAAEAERLADTPAVKDHVRADRLILEHLRAYLAMTRAEWDCDFKGAVAQAGAMLERRKALHGLSPFYCQPDDAKPESGFYYWGIVARRDYYQKLADLTSGKAGTLVAVLPEKVAFRTDPRDEGRFAGWYAPGFADRGWERRPTTRPFYYPGHLDRQGYPYLGAIWYRFTVDVPATAAGRPVRLYAPAVETEAWGWVNGKFVGHRPYREAYVRPNEIDFDVTKALRPGRKNSVVLRVHTGFNAAQAASGLVSRLFLYAVKNGPAAKPPGK